MDLSILIATRDRADTLARTLDSLAAQGLTGLTWEVVVVDNGSSDATPHVLASAREALPLVTIVEPTAGKNTALNRALDVARGGLLIFTDDDVVPARDWAARLHEASRRWPHDNIFGGAIQPRFPKSAPAWLSGEAFPYGRWAFGQYAPRTDEGPTGDTPLGSNVAIQSRVLRDTRFDESMGPKGSDYPMGSEVDLLLRLYRRGEQFIFVPSARVEHVLAEHSITRSHLSGRAYRSGRGNARLLPDLGSFPLFGIPLYTLKRSLRVFGGALIAPLRGERDRCVALLSFHQLRGELVERRRILASKGAPVRQFPGWGAFKHAIQGRGLLGLMLTPVRWVLGPLVRWEVHQFFEWNLEQPPPEPPNASGVRIRVVRGLEHSRTVRVALCPLERLKPEKIDRRLARGDSVAIALAFGHTAGYGWTAYTDLPMPEVQATVRVQASDVVGYDGWVSPRWRGYGILPLLDSALLKEAIRLGRRRQLVATSTRNRATLHAMRRVGKRKLFKIAYVRFPLVDWEFRWVFGAPYSTYFTDSFLADGQPSQSIGDK